MNTIVMALEGVLASSRDLSQAQPIESGVLLYHGLTSFRLVLSTISSDQEKVEHWLSLHRLDQHDQTLLAFPGGSVESYAIMRDRQLTYIRGHGYDVRLYIDADPDACEIQVRRGVTTMLFARPSFYGDFHPDQEKKPRPWESLVKEVDRQQEMLVADRRRPNDV